MLSEFLDAARTLAANNLPIVAGGVVAVLVLTYLFFKRRQPGASWELEEALAAAATRSSHVVQENKADTWQAPEKLYADRRCAVRRDGSPVRVHLYSPTLSNGINDGYVLDRSTGGLRILFHAAIAPGGTLNVKAINAPASVDFVKLIVRSCRKNGEHFELGCEFEKTPPWNVLLLFG
jgi:hypothetical protein